MEKYRHEEYKITISKELVEKIRLADQKEEEKFKMDVDHPKKEKLTEEVDELKNEIVWYFMSIIDEMPF